VEHGISLKELLSEVVENVSGDPLTIVVSRRNVLKSATIATQKPDFTYNRVPVVTFVGEDAEDDGGPRREFFRSVFIVRQIDSFLACSLSHTCTISCHKVRVYNAYVSHKFTLTFYRTDI